VKQITFLRPSGSQLPPIISSGMLQQVQLQRDSGLNLNYALHLPVCRSTKATTPRLRCWEHLMTTLPIAIVSELALRHMKLAIGLLNQEQHGTTSGHTRTRAVDSFNMALITFTLKGDSLLIMARPHVTFIMITLSMTESK